MPATGLRRHPLPTDATFSAALARWGLEAGSDVVVYDDANGALCRGTPVVAAAVIGYYDRVAVLDGVVRCVASRGMPLETGAVERDATTVQVARSRRRQASVRRAGALPRRSRRCCSTRAWRAALSGRRRTDRPVAGHVLARLIGRFPTISRGGSGASRPRNDLRRNSDDCSRGLMRARSCTCAAPASPPRR